MKTYIDTNSAVAALTEEEIEILRNYDEYISINEEIITSSNRWNEDVEIGRIETFIGYDVDEEKFYEFYEATDRYENCEQFDSFEDAVDFIEQ